MFADDTNIFYSLHNIKTLFTTVSKELSRIRQWFKANKLGLNIKKTKYMFFHKTSVKCDKPLKLPDLNLANKIIERKNSIKFFEVMLDENLSWRSHIDTIENKI